MPRTLIKREGREGRVREEWEEKRMTGNGSGREARGGGRSWERK
jgi:hypothetical protein